MTTCGASIVAPISAYQGADGHEYLVVEAGEARKPAKRPTCPNRRARGWFTYRLSTAPTVMNDTTGQPAANGRRRRKLGGRLGRSGLCNGQRAVHFRASVGRIEELYLKQCLSCHGAHLQASRDRRLAVRASRIPVSASRSLYGIRLDAECRSRRRGSLYRLEDPDDAAVTAYILGVRLRVSLPGTTPTLSSRPARLALSRRSYPHVCRRSCHHQSKARLIVKVRRAAFPTMPSDSAARLAQLGYDVPAAAVTVRLQRLGERRDVFVVTDGRARRWMGGPFDRRAFVEGFGALLEGFVVDEGRSQRGYRGCAFWKPSSPGRANVAAPRFGCSPTSCASARIRSTSATVT